jgi:hypothetical protein
MSEQPQSITLTHILELCDLPPTSERWIRNIQSLQPLVQYLTTQLTPHNFRKYTAEQLPPSRNKLYNPVLIAKTEDQAEQLDTKKADHAKAKKHATRKQIQIEIKNEIQRELHWEEYQTIQFSQKLIQWLTEVNEVTERQVTKRIT